LLAKVLYGVHWDSMGSIRLLSGFYEEPRGLYEDPVRVLWEFYIGLHRIGVQYGVP
jgi:hypothetical protein